MSWHDPARSLEPDTDSTLRNELRGLLGMPAQSTSYFECEASPDLIRLADSLRQEARRRNHMARRRGSWMLLAAALPLALAMGGLGVWGLEEQHKADHLAAAVARQETRIQQLAAAQLQQAPQSQTAEVQQHRAPTPALRAHPPQRLLAGAGARGTAKPRELVIQVPRSTTPNLNDTQNVKAQ
jgi:hypothetical protein